MILNEENIKQLCAQFMRNSKTAISRRHYNNCLKYLQALAYTKYSFYQGYKDDEIEQLLSQLSLQLHTLIPTSAIQKNRCVFYDSFSLDNRGLTQQYLRAMISAGWEILYITEIAKSNKGCTKIIKELSQYPLSTIVYTPSHLSGLKRSQYIYEKIVTFNPSKLFIHIAPWSVCAATAFYKVPNTIKKYLINLTDHTFWIGSKCFDYIFEFRSYGATISERYRGIQSDSIFMLPYYSITTYSPFKGVPSQCDGKVVIFSGGSYYKIFDENNTYLKLVKNLLDSFSNMVLLYAGDGNKSLLKQFIEENGYEDRFLLLGFREDINEMFKHCDIYLNTYPLGGGLMCQYAAANSIPILCFEPNNANSLETVICQLDYVDLTSHTMEDFIQEAKNLILDKEYRVKKGRAIHHCIIDDIRFNSLFLQTVTSGTNQIDYSLIEDNKIVFFNILDKIKYENNTKGYFTNVVNILRLRSIAFFSIRNFCDVFLKLFKKYIKLFYNKFK